MAITRVRPKLSDSAPAKTDVIVAVIKIDEMTKPSKEDERTPNDSANEDMAVIGPMLPVSRLSTYVKRYTTAAKEIREARFTH